MKANQLMEETGETAETCDDWGHVICEETRPPKVENRPMITCECDLWGHPCPHFLWPEGRAFKSD